MPAATSASASRSSRKPLVVSDEVVDAVDARAASPPAAGSRGAPAARRRSGGRRRRPSRPAARRGAAISSKLRISRALEPRQALGGHAVLAAEVAAVGDRDAQVAEILRGRGRRRRLARAMPRGYPAGAVPRARALVAARAGPPAAVAAWRRAAPEKRRDEQQVRDPPAHALRPASRTGRLCATPVAADLSRVSSCRAAQAAGTARASRGASQRGARRAVRLAVKIPAWTKVTVKRQARRSARCRAASRRSASDPRGTPSAGSGEGPWPWRRWSGADSTRRSIGLHGRCRVVLAGPRCSRLAASPRSRSRDRADAGRRRAGACGSARRRRAPRPASPTAVSVAEEALGDRRLHRLDVARRPLVEGRDVVLEARALEHRAVEGQAEVGEQVAAHRARSAVDGSSVTRRGHGGDDVEAVERLAGALAALAHLGHDDVADVVGVAQPQHTPSAISPASAQHAGRQRGDVDRQVGARLDAAEAEAGAATSRPAGGSSPRRIARTIADVLAHLGAPACRSSARASPRRPAGARRRGRG